MQNKHSPRLVLIGSALATAGVVSACNNSAAPVLDVMRNDYPSQEACLQDWGDPKDCKMIGDDAAGAAAASGASAASSASLASGASSTATHSHAYGYGGHWYGPYYTRRGVVYHEDGSTSQRVAPPPIRSGTTTTEMHIRESELHTGSGAFSRTSSAEAAHESHVVSRGGFLRGAAESMHAGRGFLGFHGFGFHGGG